MSVATVPASGNGIRGAQDEFINPEPDSTLFKHEYKQFTNFALHTQQVVAQGSSSVQTNSQQQIFKLHQSGDLLGKVYLHLICPALSPVSGSSADFMYLVNSVGYAILDSVNFYIASQLVDSQRSEFMEAMHELACPPGKRLDEMIGKYDSEAALIQAAQGQQVFIVPMWLWFCQYYGDFLPMCALLDHDVQIRIRYNASDLWSVNRGDDSYTRPTTLASNITASLLCQYVYLDDAEREFYKNSSMKILIRQAQVHDFTTTAVGGTWTKQTISSVPFNHPVSFLMWMIRPTPAIDGTTYRVTGVGLKDRFDYGDDSNGNTPGETVVEPNFTLNNNASWEHSTLPSLYFRKTQAMECWNNVPSRNIYTFNYGPHSAAAQTYGTLNLSKIDTKQFSFYQRTATASPGWIFAYNRNVLLTNNGQGVVPFAS